MEIELVYVDAAKTFQVASALTNTDSYVFLYSNFVKVVKIEGNNIERAGLVINDLD